MKFLYLNLSYNERIMLLKKINNINTIQRIIEGLSHCAYNITYNKNYLTYNKLYKIIISGKP